MKDFKLKKVKFTRRFLDKSWEWLNDPEIKKLTGTPDFSRKDQLNWFNNLSNNKTYRIWGISDGLKPIGGRGYAGY